MKARVKTTGEIVDAVITQRKTHTGEQVYVIDNCCLIEESRLDFNVDDTPDYWARLEHQYAGMVIQGMLSNEYAHKLYLDNKNYPNGLLNDSIAIAHTLIQKLKEKEEK